MISFLWLLDLTGVALDAAHPAQVQLSRLPTNVRHDARIIYLDGQPGGAEQLKLISPIVCTAGLGEPRRFSRSSRTSAVAC